MKSQTSNAFRRSLFDQLLDGLAYCQMIFDKQGNPVDFICVKVNKNFEKLTGLEAVTGKKATELIPGITASHPELFAIYGRVSLTGGAERFEMYVESLSRWFSVSVYGVARGFFVTIFQNITDRKEAEKDLENAKIAASNILDDLSVEKSKVEIAWAKEEAILLSIGDGLLATDEKGIVTLINKTAEKLFGKENKEVVGRVFSEVLPIEDEKGLLILPEKLPISMALATTTTTTTGIAYYYVRKDKTRFPMAITVAPILLDGKIIGTIGVFRDITKEKEIDRAKSEFISLASHQLKTPPTAIKLLTERLLDDKMGRLTERQREYCNDIRSLNQRMIDLVNALLDVSRIELGAFAIQVSEKDACAVVRSVLNELNPLLIKKRLRLKIIAPEKNTALMMDEPLFRVIINNLVTNAINYTAEGGEMRVECGTAAKGQTLGGKVLKENCFVIIVSDTGYGIPQDQQSGVFTKFFRADNAREKHADGTGLGLYIVKSILDHTGGLIWFTSHIDEGSVFYMAIPMTGMRARSGEKSPLVGGVKSDIMSVS